MNVSRNKDLDLIDLTGLDEALVIDLREGLQYQIQGYERSIRKHGTCEARKCVLYTTPKYGQTCVEDMMFLNGQIALIYRFLHKLDQIGL